MERILAPFEAPGLTSYTAPVANAVETRFAYDSHGNVLSKTQTLLNQSLEDKTLTFNFTYDSADRLTGTTYPQDGAIPSAKHLRKTLLTFSALRYTLPQ